MADNDEPEPETWNETMVLNYTLAVVRDQGLRLETAARHFKRDSVVDTGGVPWTLGRLRKLLAANLDAKSPMERMAERPAPIGDTFSFPLMDDPQALMNEATERREYYQRFNNARRQFPKR